MNEINVLLPEIFLTIVVCGLLMVGVFTKCGREKYVNIMFALAFIIAAYFLLFSVPDGEIFAFNHLFKTSNSIRLIKLLILVSTVFYILLLKENSNQISQCSITKTAVKLYEFPVLITLATIGMLLMLSSNNFLSFYVSVELQSLSLYVLAAYERENSKSSEAGIKYFVLGAFASGLLLFGISLIYGFTGNVDFSSLKTLLINKTSANVPLGVIVGIIMVLIGLFFKVSAAPFHMWTPDVYQGSPTVVTSFFATIAKIASVGFLFRITSDVLSGWKIDLQPILVLISCASVLIGAIGALKQDNLKRLLAYSSISNVGYMILAISAFNSVHLNEAILSYLLIYVIMTLSIFTIIMNIKSGGSNIILLQDLSGLSKGNPLIAMSLAIFLFSLAGIPPFAGFFAKFYIFNVAIEEGLYGATVISIIAAVISAYYYLKIVKIMYLDEIKSEFSNEMNFETKFIISLFTIFNLFYILMV